LTNELRTALEEGNDARALTLIQAMPPAEREEFSIAAQEADLLGLLGRHDEELAILDRLVSDNPTNPGLQLSVANALKTVGRRDEAIESARQALALRPGYGKAWWVLAELKTFAFSAEDVDAMEQAMAAPQSDADALHLQFALGRAYEQRGETERAFAAYAAGNTMVAAAMPPGFGRVTERIDRAIATFTPEFFAERDGFGAEAADPVFVVGLHRSGSTLIEQILGSHPLIEATAELPLINQLMRSVARDDSLPGDTPVAKLGAIDAKYARALGAQYLERAGDYRTTTKPRFIDKMPANWRHIGFIRLILPNATIIDARRHPMAAGFSNFRQNYGAGAAWTYSLDGIGRYYRDYLRLMRHFEQVLPGKIHRVINEQLIDDFEPEVRRLLDFAGVEFEPACLEFHRSTRPVRSASAEQVRRPVNRDGVDQWRPFEPWLGPLRDALGDALEDWRE
jgi:tetratricopeptide (TPR) repeat protein